MWKSMHRAVAPALLSATLLASMCATSSHVQAEESLDLLQRRIDVLQNQGKYSEAVAVAREAVAVTERVYGAESRETARELYRLGNLLRRSSQFGAAEPFLRRALAIFERNATGRDDKQLSEALTELGWTSLYTLRLDEAQRFFQRSLEMNERLLGPNALAVAYCLDGLSSTHVYLSQYGAASRYEERSLRIKRQELNSTDKDVVFSLALLATIKLRNGEVDEAAALFEEGLKIEQARQPVDELSVADLLGLLGVVSFERGDYQTAERRARESMTILERADARDRGTYIAGQNLLANVLASTQRFAEAETVALRLLQNYGSSASMQARDAMQANNTLSIVYASLNRYSDAEEVLKRALAIAEGTFGETSVDVAVVLENLAYLYSSIGRSGEALELFNRIVRIREPLLSANHPLIGSTYANRANTLNTLQRYAEAEIDARRGIQILTAVYGQGYPMALTTLDILATSLRGLGRYTEAISTIESGIAITKTTEGEVSPRIAVYLHNLGLVLDSAGRYEEAEKAFLRSLAGKPGGTLEEAQTRKVLAQTYIKMSRHREARQNFKIAIVIFAQAFEKASAARREYEGEAWLSDTASAYLAVLLDSPDFTDAERKAAISESFEIAQLLMRTRVSVALSQVATRYVAGDDALANLVRVRQDLLQRWLALNGQLDQLIAKSISLRNKTQTAAVQDALDSVTKELAKTDQSIERDFPKHTGFANPRPISTQEAKALLRSGEALVQFHVSDQRVVVWVLTPEDDDLRYVVSMTALELTRAVFDLRCGLDFETLLAPNSLCSVGYRGIYSRRDHEAGKPLPFDAARAYQLYTALIGPGAHLLRGKHLIAVLSGALTHLPLQVLLESLPDGSPPSGEQTRDVGLFGAELRNVVSDLRSGGKASGVAIVNVTPDSAAARAGLKSQDVVLSIGSDPLVDVQQAIAVIRSKAPFTTVRAKILRGGEQLDVGVTLGTLRLREWRPLFLDSQTMRAASWLARSHAITVLPSISSLKALRRYTGVSRANDAYVGFGNPLLWGEPDRFPEDSARAVRARMKQCAWGIAEPIKLLTNILGRTQLVFRDGNRTLNVEALRKWSPLPETADELCEVARNLSVDPYSHVYIGANATEKVVKQLSKDGVLARHKIVHFATHGVVAGELPSNAEPGLILTPPDKATEADDGYLTASEISSLQLDADWVILSACNTATGDGGLAHETLSGLARAFFYAGARSMLVSHWAVASDSSVHLITEAVRELTADSRIGRSEALRRSILAMITRGSDRETHPAMWAPFVLVGEGGSRE